MQLLFIAYSLVEDKYMPYLVQKLLQRQQVWALFSQLAIIRNVEGIRVIYAIIIQVHTAPARLLMDFTLEVRAVTPAFIREGGNNLTLGVIHNIMLMLSLREINFGGCALHVHTKQTMVGLF